MGRKWNEMARGGAGSAIGGLYVLAFLSFFGVLFIAGACFAANIYYVDATNGDDSSSNLGTDINHPWKTIAKVNTKSDLDYFQPGDSILFKRGETWNEHLTFNSSGSSESSITISSYGDGPLPVMYTAQFQGVSYVDVSNLQATNVNSFPSLFIYYSHDMNVLNCVFDGNNQDNGAAVVGGLASPQTWTYNIVIDGCTFKNAGTELHPIVNLTILGDSHDVTVKNSESFGATDNGFLAYDQNTVSPYYRRTSHSPYNISFINNNVHDNAGGIELGWGTCDSRVAFNKVYNNYLGILVGLSGNLIEYNLVTSNVEGIKSGNIEVSNISIFNNTVVMTTAASSYKGIWIQAAGENSGSIQIKNNIVTSDRPWFPLLWIADFTKVVCDYNIYYSPISTNAFAQGDNTYYSNFTAWKTAIGQEEHSIWGDPLFASSSDYHLQYTSPAINAGSNTAVGRSNQTDYDGTYITDASDVLVAPGGCQDIGAYEYIE